MPRTELYIHMYIIYTHICVFVYAYDDTSMFLCIWVDGQAGGWWWWGRIVCETKCLPIWDSMPQRKCAQEHDGKTGNLITHAPLPWPLTPSLRKGKSMCPKEQEPRSGAGIWPPQSVCWSRDGIRSMSSSFILRGAWGAWTKAKPCFTQWKFTVTFGFAMHLVSERTSPCRTPKTVPEMSADETLRENQTSSPNVFHFPLCGSAVSTPPHLLQILTEFKGSSLRSNFRVSMSWHT